MHGYDDALYKSAFTLLYFAKFTCENLLRYRNKIESVGLRKFVTSARSAI